MPSTTTRTAIVTGGGSGIGRALAGSVTRRGWHAVLADIDEQQAALVADDLTARGPGTAEPATLDVADPDAVTDLVDRVSARHGRLDLLCNNAGIGSAVEAEELTLAHWRRTLDVNLRGVVHGCHAATPVMRAQGHGRILNTASLAGLLGGLDPGQPYATTKFGVVGLSLSLRVAAARWGVGVHVVCPGVVETPLLDRTSFVGIDQIETDGVPTAREMAALAGLTRHLDPDQLVREVWRGVARDRAIIVAPLSARLAWRAFRLAPETTLRAAIAAGRLRRRKVAASG